MIHSWYGLTCMETISLSNFSQACLANPWMVGGLEGGAFSLTEGSCALENQVVLTSASPSVQELLAQSPSYLA